MRLAASCLSKGRYDNIEFSEPMSSSKDDDAIRGIGLGIDAIAKEWIKEKIKLANKDCTEEGIAVQNTRFAADDAMEKRARVVCDIRYAKATLLIDVSVRFVEGKCEAKTPEWAKNVAAHYANFSLHMRGKLDEAARKFVSVRLCGNRIAEPTKVEG